MKNYLHYGLSIPEATTLRTSISLPLWLDNYIFDELGAKYCRSNSNMTVIDWDKSDVLNYLGTYFPRSYAEAYCIFEKHRLNISTKQEISVFDFGCGTGGEIIGLLSVLTEQYENLKQVNVYALDGNKHSLRLYEKILDLFQSKTPVSINNRVISIEIDDFYDLSILESVIPSQFDIIISFKAICEFVTKQQFEQNNPYEHIAKVFLSKLSSGGTMCIADVTTYNNVSKKWLPHMMDIGLSNANCNVISKNSRYNQSFSVSHSRKHKDLSKVAWRIIEKAE